MCSTSHSYVSSVTAAEGGRVEDADILGHTYMMGDMRRRGDRRFAFDENKNLVS